VHFLDPLLFDLFWNFKGAVVNQILVGDKKRCAQNRVVPVKDYASLMCSWFVLGPEPHLLVSKISQVLRPHLFVGA